MAEEVRGWCGVLRISTESSFPLLENRKVAAMNRKIVVVVVVAFFVKIYVTRESSHRAAVVSSLDAFELRICYLLSHPE